MIYRDYIKYYSNCYKNKQNRRLHIICDINVFGLFLNMCVGKYINEVEHVVAIKNNTNSTYTQLGY